MTRSIPACAGEPPSRVSLTCWTTVYPRVCGGTVSAVSSFSTLAGLSPRVRGNLEGHVGERHGVGSIPACAGEPVKALSWEHHEPVIPAVRGTRCLMLRRQRCSGLSPRVRGNRVLEPAVYEARRSIPACAGEPPLWSAAQLLGLGLSPRVRGNQRDAVSTYGRDRSIPACAGEPRCALAVQSRSRVYPRVCGGTADLLPKGERIYGLSPRVRGNLIQPLPAPAGVGSIPACAGEPVAGQLVNTQDKVYPRVCGEPAPRRWRRWVRTVYPRVCGGTSYRTTSPGMAVGLSPRVRGTLF